MEKQEYEVLKAEILNKFGMPEYNNGLPLNESARKTQELIKTYRLDRLKASRDSDRLKNAANMALDVASLPEVKYSRTEPFELSDQELAPFTTKEVDLLRSHFENLNLRASELGRKHGWSTSKVVALFHSAAYKILYQKVFDRILPLESLIAIQKAMKQGDSKVTLEVARHYKLLQNEQMDINTKVKAIEDPIMIQKLKELGDSIS